jgi:alpha-tubulin suppressor-like RCC1 family protein
VAVGYDHTCVILKGGTVQCWGRNFDGQLGNGTCAICDGGIVECSRTNDDGKIGNGIRKDSAVPVPVTGITSAAAITAGNDYTRAVLTDGTVWIWGENPATETTPYGRRLTNTLPVEVKGIKNAIFDTGAREHNCVALADGSVRCWAWNYDGEIDSDTGAQSSVGALVMGMTGVVALTDGLGYICAVLKTGTVQCRDTQRTFNSAIEKSESLETVAGITNAVGVAGSGNHACILLRGGTVQCWGNNQYGYLGDSSRVSSSVPVAVAGITNATALTVASTHSCALVRGGAVQCWGWNGNGQLGNGTTD